MDDLLAAIAGSIPAMVETYGPVFIVLMLSVGANVVLYRDNKSLQKELKEEIKAGLKLAEGFKDAFIIAADALKDQSNSRIVRQ